MLDLTKISYFHSSFAKCSYGEEIKYTSSGRLATARPCTMFIITSSRVQGYKLLNTLYYQPLLSSQKLESDHHTKQAINLIIHGSLSTKEDPSLLVIAIAWQSNTFLILCE